MLAALVEQLGGLPQINPIVADQHQEIKAALVEALGQGDMVIINAGSSAGTEDHTAQVIAELGEVLVRRVAVVPGKPAGCGGGVWEDRKDGKPGLSGVGGVVFRAVRRTPLIDGLAGKHPPGPQAAADGVSGPGCTMPSPGTEQELVRVTLGPGGGVASSPRRCPGGPGPSPPWCRPTGCWWCRSWERGPGGGPASERGTAGGAGERQAVAGGAGHPCRSTPLTFWPRC